MDVAAPQPNILAPIPQPARALAFVLRPEMNPRDALKRLQCGLDPKDAIVGVGEPLVRALGGTVEGLRTFPALSTGYEDGTENPKDAAAVEAAISTGGAGHAGSSFVAVQRGCTTSRDSGALRRSSATT